MKYKIKIGSVEFIAEVEPVAEESVEEPVVDEPVEQTETIATESEDVRPKEFASSMIHVTLGEDPVENRDMLNHFLAQGDVIIDYPGDYYVEPGVIVDSVHLDLGGSRLVSSKMAYGGALIIMRGLSPKVSNGQLSGLYSAAKGEEGYIHVEYPDENGYQIPIDSTIKFPIGGFSNAVIDNVKIDHCAGYAIAPGGENQLEEHYKCRSRAASTVQRPLSGHNTFALHDGYPWITARHGIAYGYNVSEAKILYDFLDDDDEHISSAVGVPGEPILKPCGASIVRVYTTIEPFVQFVLDEYIYDNTLRISNCDFWCNQRLAVANLPGDSLIENCRSWSNGYPREDHTGIGWDNDTSGFIDVEDVQTPYLEIINCTSEHENLGIASRAYILDVADCKSPIQIYGGWEANIKRCVGRICHTKSDCNTVIRVEDSVLKGMHGAKIGPHFELEGCAIELCSALNQIDNFACVIGDDYVRSVCIYLDGVVRGSITGKDGWFELATKETSNLRIRLNEDEEFKTRSAVDDCWGLDSNVLVLPGGHTIHDSRFVINKSVPYPPHGASAAASAFFGTYKDCEFEIHSDEPFVSNALWFDRPIELTFTGCQFWASSTTALIKGAASKGLPEGSILRFQDCILNGAPMSDYDAKQFAMHDIAGVDIKEVDNVIT